MATPDPEGFSLLSKVLAATTTIVVPLSTLYKLGTSALDKKADKSDLEDVKEEVAQRRRIDEKLFDELNRHAQRDEQLFREVIEKMGEHHSQLMERLGGKADR